MKRRMMSLLAAVVLLATAGAPVTVVWAEEELSLSVSENEMVLDKDNEKSDAENILDQMNNANESILGALGKKDWEKLAKSVEKTGDWREDLVAVAQSQVGYKESSNGTTIYTKWAGYEDSRAWTALFVNWVAAQAGLSTKEFPSAGSYDGLVSAMKNVGAVKGISRSTYPTAGDLALIEADGQKLAAIVVYVSNCFASVIHGDDKGEVTRTTYKVDGYEFSEYVDLNVLMERVGIEVGKGGEVPEIPEGGVAAWTNTNAVYMRQEPTTASKRVTTIKKENTAVVVTSAEKQDDGYIWYGVEYNKYSGYIRGDLLELDVAALAGKSEAPETTETPETPSLGVQDRVVNVEVVQGTGEVKITFEIYGATQYDWYRVGTKGDGTDDELVFSGKGTTYQAYPASASGTYYCKATIANNFVVESKKTTVEVSTGNESLITSNAILGEEVKFTYTYAGEAYYQWFEIITPEGSSYSETKAIPGATLPTLTMLADPEKVGVLYYCIARDENDGKLAESSRYSYTIKVGTEFTEADLCKYIEELANMTRSDRYEIMTNEWASVADQVLSHWQQEHTSVYSTLLCTCGMKHPYNEKHQSTCPWYTVTSASSEQPEPLTQSNPAITERIKAEPEFGNWVLTATSEMIARALQAATLDHLVVDGNELYVAREAAPRATVDSDGYVTDIASGFKIARIVDGVFYPIKDAPTDAGEDAGSAADTAQ